MVESCSIKNVFFAISIYASNKKLVYRRNKIILNMRLTSYTFRGNYFIRTRIHTFEEKVMRKLNLHFLLFLYEFIVQLRTLYQIFWD